jgi:hypothetical protein
VLELRQQHRLRLVAQLRTSDITTADSGEIAITFARGAIVLPEPLASIALALRYQRVDRARALASVRG